MAATSGMVALAAVGLAVVVLTVLHQHLHRPVAAAAVGADKEAEEADTARRTEDEAEVAAAAEALALERENANAGPHPSRLRQELATERELRDRLVAEESLEADNLRRDLEHCDEQLRRATEASRAEAARRAPLDSDVSTNCDVLSELRANVESLMAFAADLRRSAFLPMSWKSLNSVALSALPGGPCACVGPQPPALAMLPPLALEWP